MTSHAPRGFTLIELMIVVGIVAILASIALPSYNRYVLKSRRAEAMTSLQDLRLQLERWRTDHPDFSGYARPTVVPGDKHYTIDVKADGAASYTITATPKTGQDKDDCGTLVIANKSGVVTKTPTSGNCW